MRRFSSILESTPMLFKETAYVRLLSLRIPTLLFLSPSVVRLDDDCCVVKIPFGWRTRNHVGSMYVGALCAGADLASGLNAARLIRTRYRGVSLVFADIQGDFLKRADGDVLFRSDDGPRIAQAVQQADGTGERVTLPVRVVATVPDKYGEEPVARFTMGLSLKRRSAAREPTRAHPATPELRAGGR
jgi:acyl-coenzyme A thioesterase PaaI-like protein